MPGGGIIPARSFRMTCSQISAWSATAPISRCCRERLAVLTLSLWQTTQYWSTRARSAAGEAGIGANALVAAVWLNAVWLNDGLQTINKAQTTEPPSTTVPAIGFFKTDPS